MMFLVTGGTGTFGTAIVRELLSRGHSVRVFSRDEAKQFHLAQEVHGRISFVLGDIRDFDSIYRAMDGVEMVIHCAAMKHVGLCEQNPYEAVQTNVLGVQNLVSAVAEHSSVRRMLAISTDKVCEPYSVMGCTKLVMERIITQAAQTSKAVMGCVRFGNVVPSRGSVFEIFQKLITEGKPLIVTSKHMTRFLLPLHYAPAMILTVLDRLHSGDVWIPRLRSAYVDDIAKCMVGEQDNDIFYGYPKPGEKMHEDMVSEGEAPRTTQPGSEFFCLHPPWVDVSPSSCLSGPYNSKHQVMAPDELGEFLKVALRGYR